MIAELVPRDVDVTKEGAELLRFLTCGSVDDGKSTLIGRLLFDTKSIFEDQLAHCRGHVPQVGTTGDEYRPRAAG